jgi:UPF0755 protein
MNFRTDRRDGRTKKFVIIAITAAVLLVLLSVAMIRKSYADNLKPVNLSSKTTHVITVEPGSGPSAVADNLKAKGVIRSDWAFEWYLRNKGLGDQLKAGTYVVGEAQSVEEIVQTLIDGKVATDLVTILPGKRLQQVKEGLIKSGFTEADVDAALNPSQYAGHPALTDKPEGQSLEGYLYPESFQKTAETTPKEIISQSLDEMQRRLTPALRESFSKQGLTLHQAITLASIVEQEVSNEADRAQASQVFMKRYKSGMQLGSDPTAFYGAHLAGQEPTVFFDSPYNTRKYSGLPPGPIGNVTESSLQAIAEPAQTDWLYFVSGDDGRTHFSKTLQEHEELTKKYCTKLCGR